MISPPGVLFFFVSAVTGCARAVVAAISLYLTAAFPDDRDRERHPVFVERGESPRLHLLVDFLLGAMGGFLFSCQVVGLDEGETTRGEFLKAAALLVAAAAPVLYLDRRWKSASPFLAFSIFMWPVFLLLLPVLVPHVERRRKVQAVKEVMES